MSKKKDEKIKEQIKLRLLSGVNMLNGNEYIKKEELERIIDNIVNELLSIQKLSSQAMQSIMM